MFFGNILNNHKKKILLAQAGAGFTLIEVMVALSIISLVFLSAISFFPKGLQTAVSSSQKTTAIFLAQSKMEEIISQKYDTLVTGQTIENNLSSIHSDFTGYSRQTNIIFVDENLSLSQTDEGLKKVEVSISWTDSLLGQSASTSLVSLITDL